MTTIVLSTDIPTQINTLERLAAWVIMALRRTNPTLSVIEVADQTAEKVVQSAIIQSADGKIRFVGRVSIEIDPAFAEDNTNKLWTKALEFSNTQLPAAYKVN